jgi:molybdopterin-guanine dinucleotide biosynthesis protein A
LSEQTENDPPAAPSITGVILAGGAGRRAGHRDKGLLPWCGRPLVAHVRDRLAGQVDSLVISCNRNAGRYREWAAATVADRREGYQGPLAGIEACAEEVRGDLLIVVTCDVPRLPTQLVPRLVAQLRAQPVTDIAFAHDGRRAHYLCAALRASCLDSLTPFLDGGGRAVRDWYAERGAVAVDFSDVAPAFENVNRPGG